MVTGGKEINQREKKTLILIWVKEPENEDFASRNPTDISLPEPELSNLKEISDVLHNAHSLDDKDKLSAYIMTEVIYLNLQFASGSYWWIYLLGLHG